MPLTFCFKSFKVKLIFYNKGEFKISFEHNYNHVAVIDDKKLREEFSADPGYVYFLESEFGWKIGKTRNLDNRRRVFDVKLPFEIALRYFVKSHEITRLEAYFHKHFKDRNLNGEWFVITNDEIRDCVGELGNLKLRFYYPDKNIFIEKKYLSKCNVAFALKGL
jgi:hypothetical protein